MLMKTPAGRNRIVLNTGFAQVQREEAEICFLTGGKVLIGPNVSHPPFWDLTVFSRDIFGDDETPRTKDAFCKLVRHFKKRYTHNHSPLYLVDKSGFAE